MSDGYDAADNSAKCYALAIETMRGQYPFAMAVAEVVDVGA